MTEDQVADEIINAFNAEKRAREIGNAEMIRQNKIRLDSALDMGVRYNFGTKEQMLAELAER